MAGTYMHTSVCEITFEIWADTLSGLDKVFTDILNIALKLLKLWVKLVVFQ